MLRLTISNDQQRRQVMHDGGVLELGRGPKLELERFIIQDRFVSRNQLRVEQVGDNVRVENLGSIATFDDGRTLQQDEVCESPLPVRITVGYTTVEIADDAENLNKQTHDPDALLTISPPVMFTTEVRKTSSLHLLGDSPKAEQVAVWFEGLLVVQRAAAGSDEFYQETANVIVDMVGLDKGMVLIREGENEWEVAARSFSNDRESGRFSRTVLKQVVEQKRTWYQACDDDVNWTESLAGVESVVASPITDSEGNVVGALYGSRSLLSQTTRKGIHKLEAQFMQTLAAAVGAGLLRRAQEEDAARRRAQLERFCSPQLAAELERNPQLLQGDTRDVTVMFADLRGCSRLPEEIGAKSHDLLADVMDFLTEEILRHEGVIIDYYGDGLAAMWNAPSFQEDHCIKACLAAIDIQKNLSQVSDKWRPIINRDLALGVGVNTGSALVGNAGSKRRMKYGPRGQTVNLTQRVEAATKDFGVPILITAAVQNNIGGKFLTRRLRSIRPKGMGNPVDVFELLHNMTDPHWSSRRACYEQALKHFESADFVQARDMLQALLENPVHKDDTPCIKLAKSAAKLCQQPPVKFDPVLNMQNK